MHRLSALVAGCGDEGRGKGIQIFGSVGLSREDPGAASITPKQRNDGKDLWRRFATAGRIPLHPEEVTFPTGGVYLPVRTQSPP